MELGAPLNTSNKVALNFWLIDTEMLKSQAPFDQLHDLVSAVLGHRRLDADIREKLMMICLKHVDPTDEKKDFRRYDFD
jgi:hypothetical protein